MSTRPSVSEILHLVNKTPFYWYSKKQSMVETATNYSGFTTARIAVNHDVNHRNMYRYLGVEVKHTTYLFGDNESVMNSSTIPHAKQYDIQRFFHQAREAIASKIRSITYIPGIINPEDILS